ncbi:adenosylcobalamin-dependent ribonucleoside-diphosphate reductase [Candidatus Microgenomates bacterium]|nr:adenosylcobalamin-dependent ribonucleoside-diphosphate reductase [Candidatus Microgenomates bacterium]
MTKLSIAKIKKRDGRVVAFDAQKILKAIELAGSDTGEFNSSVAKTIAQKVMDKLALKFNRKDTPTVEEIQDIVEPTIAEAGYFATAKHYILYRHEHAKIRGVQKALGVPDDVGLPLNSLRVLEARYLIRDVNRNIIESPRDLFQRVSKTIAAPEKKWGGEKAHKKYEEVFFGMMTRREFIPNSPTLMNAGVGSGQLSACFVIPVPDDMGGIFDAVKAAALIHQTGGGTGFSFSRLRPKGDIVKSSSGVASGPVSFMRVFNMATEVIKQGGKRRGANMGILRVDHPDILDFITCKEDMVSITNFNISVTVTEKFMEAVEKNKEYELINPHNKKVTGKLNARMVFDMMVLNAWKNGDPGIIFIDRINRTNPTPHIAEIEATNPCGEQPLMPYDACNLGSINLAQMLKVRSKKQVLSSKDKPENYEISYEIDWEKLERITRLATRFLDNVIDANTYPLPEIDKTVRENRTIGLGIMGWADLLIDLRIPYNSDEAVKLAEKVMKFITEKGRDESVKLGRERGSFPNFKGSTWQSKGYKYMRNRTVTTIAPTGTIGLIADCSQGIEPIFALAHLRRSSLSAQENLGDELLYTYQKFEEELKRRNLYSEELMSEVAKTGSVSHLDHGLPSDIKKIYVTAHEISPVWHLKMQAAFQKYTDNAVSKTVNFAKEATTKDVEEVYMLAYKLGCKGVTIYRDSSRPTQVLNLDISKKKAGEDKVIQTGGAINGDTGPKNVDEPPAADVSRQPLYMMSSLDKKKITDCPTCGAKLVFSEGCATCLSCGYSHCSV